MDWKAQLQSEDPRVRVEAIKAIANSGNRANIPYLKEVVENDIDPRVQDYARKAARHLFTSTEGPIPDSPPPQEEPVTKSEEAPQPPEPEASIRAASIPPSERTSAETKIQRALSLHMRGDTQKALKAFVQGLDLDPNLSNETFTRSVASELTGLSSDQALDILMDPETRKELLAKKKTADAAKKAKAEESVQPDKHRKPRGGIVQTWLSFFFMNEGFLADEAEKANTEDTFLSMLVFTIAAVVITMITGFIQFQRIIVLLPQLMAEMGESMPPLDINFGVIFIVMLLGTLIMTPLSFIITSGLQFLGVKIFGGSGDFRTHLYLLALIHVPFTILSGVISLLGLILEMWFVIGLIGLGLSIFTLIIYVRAAKAVHNVSTGRAVGGVLILPIILIAVGGCLMMVFGSALIGALAGLQ
jgi:hypothetical protein